MVSVQLDTYIRILNDEDDSLNGSEWLWLKRKFHNKKNTWSTCGQNQSKVSSFYAAKQEIPHDNPFPLKADESPILAGHDTGANPVEHLLHALAGCLTTTFWFTMWP